MKRLRSINKGYIILGVILFIFAWTYLVLKSAPQLKPKPVVVEEPTVEVEVPRRLPYDVPRPVITMEYDLTDMHYEHIYLKVERITAYNAEKRQTSSTPHVSASNRIVFQGQVAISQDILDKYVLRPGDIVYIISMDKWFVYEDKMAYGRKPGERKITSTIDVFLHSKEEAKTFLLKDQEIVILKIPRNQ